MKKQKSDSTKQTPSNTICMGKGSQAGWGTDGKVHCFKPKSDNSGNTSSNPSGGFQSGGGSYSGKGGSSIVTHHEYPSNGYQGGNSSSYSGINTKGGSYSSPEQHIQQVCASLGGNVLGGAYHDGRKNRDKFGDGINYQVKGIISETKYYGFKNPKGIVLSDCALEDRDIAVLTNHLKCHRLDLDVFDVSNNKIGLGGVKNLFCGLRIDNPLAERYIVTMNFSNNVIGDDGAKYMADSLAMGRFLNLKSLNVSGNQITGTGEGYFAKALESVKVTSITIVLTTKNSFKEIANFIKTGFNYYAKEFHIEQIAVDVDTQKYLTNCQKTGINLTEGFMSGFVKCKNIPNKKIAFFCFINEVVDSLFQPETLNCLIDSHKFFEHEISSLTGASSDQDIHHQECNIF